MIKSIVASSTRDWADVAVRADGTLGRSSCVAVTHLLTQLTGRRYFVG
jgi:hypothetical protein